MVMYRLMKKMKNFLYSKEMSSKVVVADIGIPAIPFPYYAKAEKYYLNTELHITDITSIVGIKVNSYRKYPLVILFTQKDGMLKYSLFGAVEDISQQANVFIQAYIKKHFV